VHGLGLGESSYCFRVMPHRVHASPALNSCPSLFMMSGLSHSNGRLYARHRMQSVQRPPAIRAVIGRIDVHLVAISRALSKKNTPVRDLNSAISQPALMYSSIAATRARFESALGGSDPVSG